MEFVDTHCHPYFDELLTDLNGVLQRAHKAGVNKMICVGVSLEDSRQAIKFAAGHNNVWASAGVHPHGAKGFNSQTEDELRELLNPSTSLGAGGSKIVATGEIGLDYYRLNSPKEEQLSALRAQIEIAIQARLPIIFHVRDAWADFWQVFDDYQGLRGVIHSFTGGAKQLEQTLSRGLYVALNGIITFTRDQALLDAAKKMPLDKLVLETDAPFLTPATDKGQVCEPRHVRMVAEFLAELRVENLKEIASITTTNAEDLFGLVNKK